MGQAERFATEVPPVIEPRPRSACARWARRPPSGARIAGAGRPGAGRRLVLPPTVAADLDPGAPVLGEEVFGPLLTVEAVASVEAACDVVDSLPFALTGGLFSRNPETVRAVSTARRSATCT